MVRIGCIYMVDNETFRIEVDFDAVWQIVGQPR